VALITEFARVSIRALQTIVAERLETIASASIVIAHYGEPMPDEFGGVCVQFAALDVESDIPNTERMTDRASVRLRLMLHAPEGDTAAADMGDATDDAIVAVAGAELVDVTGNQRLHFLSGYRMTDATSGGPDQSVSRLIEFDGVAYAEGPHITT